MLHATENRILAPDPDGSLLMQTLLIYAYSGLLLIICFFFVLQVLSSCDTCIIGVLQLLGLLGILGNKSNRSFTS